MSRAYERITSVNPLIAMLCMLVAWNAHGASLKPIVLDDSYRHDRWDIQPKDLVRQFRAYTTSFDSNDDDNEDGEPDILGIPEWVAYELRRYDGELPKGPKRPSPWITDKTLHAQGVAPADETYRYPSAFRREHPNWYVRGHLCMKQHAFRLGRNADWNTHTVLNAVPQRQDFNSGIWLDLEILTAGWADNYGAVWIVTGPVFLKGHPAAWIGEENEVKAAIPDALFKIVAKDSPGSEQPDVLAFVYPQTGDNYRRGPFDHTKYLTSVDNIETLTGLDFFSSLPPEVQDAIESTAQRALWSGEAAPEPCEPCKCEGDNQ